LYNLRYHIASLVAVFLALAMGLILGGLVVRAGVFDQQQKALVKSLRTEYGNIKQKNVKLSSQLNLESTYSKQITDAWVIGRLSGSTVVVVTSGASTEGADEVAASVKSAGGNAATVTLVKPDFGLRESTIASSVISIIASGALAAPTVSDVASALAAEWSTDSERPLTEALLTAGVIKVTGLPRSAMATLAVDVATVNGEPDTVGLDIASAFANHGLYAVGAEPLASPAGVAAAAAARKLSAFDTLGTSVGRFTLVALFTGGEQGYYSTTAKNTKPFPPVPQP
jgi:hypothetical protein